MKRFVILACALALAPFASAQLYKYVDKDGKTVYSDQPPANVDSKTLNIRSGASTDTKPADAPKSYVERDKELQKGRDAARDAAKKADDTAKLAQQKEEACNAAKGAYQQFVDGDRMHKYDSKGERVYLGEDEIAEEKAKAKAVMDENCKK